MVLLNWVQWIVESLIGHPKAFALYLENFENSLGFKRIILLSRIKAWSVLR